MRSAITFAVLLVGYLPTHAGPIAIEAYESRIDQLLTDDFSNSGFAGIDNLIEKHDSDAPALSSDLPRPQHPPPGALDVTSKPDDGFSLFGSTAVPEAETLLLVGVGLCLVGLTRRHVLPLPPHYR